jgi:hypothetical protein
MIIYGVIAYIAIILLVIGYYIARKTGAEPINPETQQYNDLVDEQEIGKVAPSPVESLN